MKSLLKAVLVLVSMLIAAGGASGLRPTQRLAHSAPLVDLELMIPKAFGDWREEHQETAQIVDPVQRQVIAKIYSNTLARTYANSDGYRVMLSIAYGSNQNDSLQVHKPEVCYPAQGFEIVAKRSDRMRLSNGVMPVQRLVGVKGGQRTEPITYWIMIGNRRVIDGIEKKIAEMHYGLQQEIPDGMLVRVSSIDPDLEKAFVRQSEFVDALIGSLDPRDRNRIAGL